MNMKVTVEKKEKPKAKRHFKVGDTVNITNVNYVYLSGITIPISELFDLKELRECNPSTLEGYVVIGKTFNPNPYSSARIIYAVEGSNGDQFVVAEEGLSLANEDEQVEWKFPCFGVSKHTGTVVMFSDSKIGTVVKISDNVGSFENAKVGHQSNDWHMNSFEPLQKVTFENE